MNELDKRVEAQQEFQQIVRRLYGSQFQALAMVKGITTRDGIEKLAAETGTEVQV